MREVSEGQPRELPGATGENFFVLGLPNPPLESSLQQCLNFLEVIAFQFNDSW